MERATRGPLREAFDDVVGVIFLLGSIAAAVSAVFAAYHGEVDRFIALLTLSAVFGLVGERK